MSICPVLAKPKMDKNKHKFNDKRKFTEHDRSEITKYLLRNYEISRNENHLEVLGFMTLRHVDKVLGLD
jgi:inorganic pyrophosphatase